MSRTMRGLMYFIRPGFRFISHVRCSAQGRRKRLTSTGEPADGETSLGNREKLGAEGSGCVGSGFGDVVNKVPGDGDWDWLSGLFYLEGETDPERRHSRTGRAQRGRRGTATRSFVRRLFVHRYRRVSILLAVPCPRLFIIQRKGGS